MTEMLHQVFLIGGPNGAGKTTLAPHLLRDKLAIHRYVNADPIALGLSGFDPSSVSFEAGRVMLSRLKSLVQERQTFALESTLAGKSYGRWIKQIRKEDYRVQLIFLWLRSPDLAVQRVAERVRDGGHDVPEEVIRRRYFAGLRNFWTLYQPLADAWAVYDNSEGACKTIARGTREVPLLIYDKLSWISFSYTRP